MKTLTSISRILSMVFSPLLMATYGVFIAMRLSFLVMIPVSTQLTVVLETFLATAVIPVIAIFLLSKFKVIADPRLNERADRTWPYIIEIVCFLGMAVYLNRIHAPHWLSLFLIGGALAIATLTVVNHWWKISGHATGMGGLCALIFYLMLSGTTLINLQPVFLGAILLAGMVGTARMMLDRHTLGQVAAGFLNGFFWVLLLPFLPYIIEQMMQ